MIIPNYWRGRGVRRLFALWEPCEGEKPKNAASNLKQGAPGEKMVNVIHDDNNIHGLSSRDIRS